MKSKPAPTSPSAPLAAGARSIAELERRAAGCRACPLFARATQTVFGEGAAHAAIMLVGEQPGDEEDLSGRPFVGPAGRYLDVALASAGIDRKTVYVTNAVKHFKWVPEPRGKRRIHSKPAYGEVQACHGWLEAELKLVAPRAIVCLGATAAQAFYGRAYSVMKHRGEIVTATPWAPIWMATYHPSALLRMPDAEKRHAAKADFIADLARAAKAAAKMAA
jgi:uracil-DNA glycosylase family protein